MTRALKALCVLFCVLLSGCGTAPVTPVTSFTAHFRAAFCGATPEGSLTYSRQGRMNLRVSTPDSIAGLSVGYGDSELHLSLEGLQCTADEAYLPQTALPTMLKTALDALSRAAENGQLDDENGTVTAEGWTIALDENGFPRYLQNGGAEIWLDDPRAL